MEIIINELTDILEQETEIYGDLLKISKNKTDTIIKGNVKELEEDLKREQTALLKVNRLEDSREKLICKLSENLEIHKNDLTITELVKHIQGEQADRLQKARNMILNIMDELKKVNELNSHLIKNSLDYINFSINIMSNLDNESNNYGITGQVKDPGKRNFFNVRL